MRARYLIILLLHDETFRSLSLSYFRMLLKKKLYGQKFKKIQECLDINHKLILKI